MQYPATTAITIPTGRNSYSYGSYGSYAQPVQYGYQQPAPVYVHPQQQQVVYTMPTNGYNMPTYSVPSYGYGMQMTSQYVPGGASVIVQDPYGYGRRRPRRHRRHSYSGYPTYGY